MGLRAGIGTEELEPLCMAAGIGKWVAAGENRPVGVWIFFKQLQIDLLCDPATPAERNAGTRRDVCTPPPAPVHSSRIHSS